MQITDGSWRLKRNNNRIKLKTVEDKHFKFIFLEIFLCIPLPTKHSDTEHLCDIFVTNPVFDFSIKVLQKHSKKEMLKPLNLQEKTALMFLVFLKLKNIIRKVLY